MSKRKHRAEWMLERVREYLAGKGSYKTIAKANGIGSKTSYRVDFSGNLLYDI